MKWVIQKTSFVRGTYFDRAQNKLSYWDGKEFQDYLSNAVKYNELNNCQSILNQLVEQGWKDLSPIQVSLN